jgi:3-hydroxyanthranilate 3,4-dioxygenase
MQSLLAFNLQRWIDENRHLLKPPVGNKCLFGGAGHPDGDFIIMVVGGPNARKDYHVDAGEEFFYQLEGDMVLRTMQGEPGRERRPIDVPIRQGDMLLLPAGVPHSPQRQANTVGLVVERRRRAAERDGFQWYCENCNNLLYEEFFELTNIETQFPAIFDRFFASEERRTCSRCATVMERKA